MVFLCDEHNIPGIRDRDSNFIDANNRIDYTIRQRPNMCRQHRRGLPGAVFRGPANQRPSDGVLSAGQFLSKPSQVCKIEGSRSIKRGQPACEQFDFM